VSRGQNEQAEKAVSEIEKDVAYFSDRCSSVAVRHEWSQSNDRRDVRHQRLLLLITAYLFAAGFLTALTQTIAWLSIFLFGLGGGELGLSDRQQNLSA
jgi:hypothetical protein